MRLTPEDEAWLRERMRRMVAAAGKSAAADARWAREKARFDARARLGRWTFEENPTVYLDKKAAAFELNAAFDEGNWWRAEAAAQAALISGFAAGARLLDEQYEEEEETDGEQPAAPPARGREEARGRGPAGRRAA